MTYEGVKATILLEYCAADSCEDCDNCVLGKAIEALEKQIPKKPMAIKIPTKWGGHDYRCPVCATRVFEQSYCMSCGQAIDCSAIDWSDEDD